MTTPERPRRLHDARICPDCLQEFPGGRGFEGHDCQPAPSMEAHQSLKARLGDEYLGQPAERKKEMRAEEAKRIEWAKNQATTASPWATDALLQIIDVLWSELPLEANLRLNREMPKITAACRHIHNLINHEPGNEIGHHRFAAAKELGLTWNPMKQAFE